MNIQNLLAWLIVAVLLTFGGIWLAAWLQPTYKRYLGDWWNQ